MNNVLHKARRMAYTNTGGTTLSAGIPFAAETSATTGMLLIPVDDILAGATGVVATGRCDETVFTIAKKVGDVFTALQRVYWDATNKYLTTTSGGNINAGRSNGAYASAAPVAGLLLNQA